MRTEAADWYDTPLYYDIIFDADTSKEADFLEAVYTRFGGGDEPRKKLRILEPACGSGRLIAELAGRGHLVRGFDLNEQMLAYTVERLNGIKRNAHVWQDRLENFHVSREGEYDLAHCLVSTFKYVQTEHGAVSHLQHVAKSLREGGIYVLGLHLTDYRNQKPEHERWVGERGGIKVICNTHTWPPDREARTEALRTRLRITRDDQTWIQETKWTFRTYSVAELKDLLAQAPEFELVACYNFNYLIDEPGRLARDSFDVVLVLRKQAEVA